MTVPALASAICLASGVFGRPAMPEARCHERAEMISEAAARHGVDPLLMVALDVHECELREDVDAPIYKKVRGRRVVVGYDACPMGVRIRGVAKRAEHDASSLYDLAASRMAVWKKWCSRGHPGKRWRGQLRDGHHYVGHYNQGNPTYFLQVLAIRGALAGRRPASEVGLTPRTLVIVSRCLRALDKRSRT